jgi:hypothetical protein
VEFVGGSDEQIAWMRLSLRRAGELLRDGWRLRREDDARVDLLIVPHFEEGTAADSMRQVRVIDPTMSVAMSVAPWPLTKDLLIEVLNRIGASTQAVAPVPASVSTPAIVVAPGLVAQAPVVQAPSIQSSIAHNNLYDDIYESSGPLTMVDVDQIEAGPDAPWLMPRLEDSPLIQEAEQLFKRKLDPELERLASIRLSASTGVEGTEGFTRMSDQRGEKRSAVGAGVETGIGLSAEEAAQMMPFSAYLGRVLPGPAQLIHDNLVITLDPRARKYHAQAALCLFDELCRTRIRRGDFKMLSSEEFAELKQRLPPRPFAELQWLCAFVAEGHSTGTELQDHEPYRLMDRIDLSRDFPPAERVAQTLLQGCSLQQAAQAARVALPIVRRVAAAFDELGWLVPA